MLGDVGKFVLVLFFIDDNTVHCVLNVLTEIQFGRM